MFPDINECVTEKSPCHRGQICINTVGSYSCQRNSVNCGRGYHLNDDGTRCIGRTEKWTPFRPYFKHPGCSLNFFTSLKISTSVKDLNQSVKVMPVSTNWVRTAASVKLDTTLTASLVFVKVSSSKLNILMHEPKTCIDLQIRLGVIFTLTLFIIIFLLDINECRHYPGRLCAHRCDNTPGSYKCTCTTGFKLAADGRNCDGELILITAL